MNETFDQNIFYGGSIARDGDMACNSLGEFFLKRLDSLGEKVVLIDGSTSEKITAQQLRHRSIRVAQALRKLGVTIGDTVFICSEDRLEFAYVLFGVIYLGAKIASVEPHFLPTQIGHMIDETKPKLIFCSAISIDTIRKLAIDRPFIEKIISFGERSDDCDIITCLEFVNDRDLLKVEDIACDRVDMNKNIALILRTSGTTGFPKGVLVTQNNLLLACMQYNKHEEVLEPIVFSVVSWVRGIGIKTLLKYVLNNSTLVFVYPQKDRIWRTIEIFEVNTVVMHPQSLKVLTEISANGIYELSSVKMIICGGALLTKDIEEMVREKLPGVSIRRTYGMVELAYITEELTDTHKNGSVGQLLPGVFAKVIDLDLGITLNPNETGELCYKGDTVMKGYLKTNDLKRKIHSDGWFHSGDIGYFDIDGDLFLVGRVDDMINVNGKKISPFLIESVLMQHPAIQECGVISVPDGNYGELPVAVVVKECSQDLAIEEIINYVLERTNIRLDKVRFVKKLPRSIIGKLMRSYLKTYCSDNPSGNKDETTPFYLRWYENHKM